MTSKTARGIMITGGYTCYNRGDWALAEAALQSLRRASVPGPALLQTFHPDVDYPILEPHTPIAMWGRSRPTRHKLLSLGLRSRYYKAQMADIRSHLRDARDRFKHSGYDSTPLLWLCGGGIMNDVSSHGRFTARLCLIAHQLGWEVVMTGQTVGPFQNPANKEQFESFARVCSYLAVRDPESFEYVSNIAGLGCVVQRTLDDAFSLEPPVGNRSDLDAITKHARDPYVLMTLHKHGGTDTKIPLSALRDTCAALTAKGLRVVLSSFSGHAEPHDAVVDELVASVHGVEKTPYTATVNQLRLLVQHAELVVSTRFHGLVFSLETDTVPVCLYAGKYYRAKSYRLMEEWGLADLAVDVAEDARQIPTLVCDALDNVENWRAVLRRHRPEVVGEIIPMAQHHLVSDAVVSSPTRS